MESNIEAEFLLLLTLLLILRSWESIIFKKFYWFTYSDNKYDYICSGIVIESQFQGSLYKIILKTSFDQQFIIHSKQSYE